MPTNDKMSPLHTHTKLYYIEKAFTGEIAGAFFDQNKWRCFVCIVNYCTGVFVIS